jgi:hypothetical protein
MGKLKLLLLIVLAGIFSASTGFTAEKNFEAKLTPAKSHKFHSSGKMDLNLSNDGNTLTYKLHVENVSNATAAHLHIGKKDTEGSPVVIIRFDNVKKGKFTGILSEGKITSMDLLGKLEGKPLGELVHLIETGDIYVNVHSYGNPAGEILGQIK